jgi:hypothetical protein
MLAALHWRDNMAGFETSRINWLSHVASIAAIAITFALGAAQGSVF